MTGTLNISRAVKLQERLARKLILAWCGRPIRSIGGADVAYDLDRGLVAALIVVCRFPGLEIEETSSAVQKLKIPYIPGFLSFREGPVFLAAFRRLRRHPDVTLFDGNGIAHPRRMGLASHVGVLLDVPTIGCAKKPFFPFRPPANRRGAATTYRNRVGDKVGYCLRTRDDVKPIFISPGHRVDFALSRRVALSCSHWRIPEPLRLAHLLARKVWAESEESRPKATDE